MLLVLSLTLTIHSVEFKIEFKVFDTHSRQELRTQFVCVVRDEVWGSGVWW
jgi:hypothetical protein